MTIRQTNVQSAQTSGSVRDRLDGQQVAGDIRYLEAVYTTTAAEAAGDVIEVATLPFGAVVLPEKSAIACEALGGTGTAIAKLGDALDDDRYSATSLALVNAGYTAVTPAVGTAVTTRTPVAAATTVLKATLALSSGSVTAGKKLVFLIAYRMP